MQETTSPAAVVVPQSLRALLEGIVDYAGLFPPAALPLEQALPNYARYRQSRDAWMLARFVLPVGRLAALGPYAGLFEADPPFRFSLLGTGGEDTAAFEKSLDADLQAIDRFHATYGEAVAADVMEVRLPPALLHAPADALDAFLDATAARIAASARGGLDVFFEVPLPVTDAPAWPALQTTLAAHRGQHPHAHFGLKMRTGGLEPAAFPDADAIAAFMVGCRDHRLRYKATAGLHHPVRHYNDGVRAHMYGFFNVFGAAALAEAHGLDAARLRDVLLDEDPAAFRFTDEAFTWRDLGVDLPTLRRTRTQLALSFGSCSFDEPREDLGWL